MGQGWKMRLAAIGAGLLSVTALGTVVVPSPTAGAAQTAPATGQSQSNFWLATPSGGVEAYGVPSYGSPTGPLNQPVVSISTTGDQKGYWLVAGDGGIFNYGDATFFGSTGNIHLNKPIVGLTPTPDGKGYWMVASDGGIFSYGDATFFGSTGNIHLNKPIVGMASTPDGKGYWLVASDGGVFSFGDATFFGSTGNITLQQPIVSMTATPDGKGYWMVAADGGVFAFGDATFFGSTANAPGEPVQRLVSTHSGNGYWIFDQNGTATAFGDAVSQSAPSVGLLLNAVTPGDKAVLFAFQQLGKPYIWGGNGPTGYDCSGLALASWTLADRITFARVSDDQYHTAGTSVPMTSLQAGDLVFWGYVQTDWTTVYHTAIYVGGNRIVEATGDQVQLNTLSQWGTDDLMPNGRRP
jgi:cell wall-associated NlpC family hydrolase